MKVFVTGATGFIGSHLVRRLLREHVAVGALIRPGSNTWRIKDVLSDVTVIQGGLDSIGASADAIRQFKPDIFFHLGWQGASSYRFQNESAQVFANLDGSLALVRLASECDSKAWIGMGSVLEYGRYPAPISEELVPDPRTLYGASKYSAGLLARKLCEGYGIRSAWFRLYWAYGPADDKARMIPYLISSLLRRERPALTPGEQRWDYIYIDDVVEALWKAAHDTAVSGAFNLGSGCAVPLRDVVECVRDLIDPALPLGFGDMPYRADQIMHLQADMTRLCATGWRPQVALEEGLRRTVDWFRQNRDE